MSSGVNDPGWYVSLLDTLKAGTASNTESEKLQNIEHSTQKAGIVKMLYVSKLYKPKRGPAIRLFLRATSMPYTAEIVERQLTAFASKKEAAKDNVASKHGYGAVIPMIYCGGMLDIYYLNETDEERVISVNIEDQKREARQGVLNTLPSKEGQRRPGEVSQFFNEDLWGPRILALFREHSIRSLEIHTNPSFMDHEDMRNKTQFMYFLQDLQMQFEEDIVNKKYEIIGAFEDDAGELDVMALPYNFYRTLYHPSSPTAEFPLSCYGATQLEKKLQFEFTNVGEEFYARYVYDGGASAQYVKVTGKGTTRAIGWEISPVIENFSPKLTVMIGHTPTSVDQYVRDLAATDSVLYRAQRLQNVEDYCDGVLVNLNGYRATALPIPAKPAISQPKHLTYYSRTRMVANIIDRTYRDNLFDAQPWKNSSRILQKAVAGPHYLMMALAFVEKAAKACVAANHDVLVALNTVRRQRKVVQKAVADGIHYERTCAEVIRTARPKDDVFEGDAYIRNEILKEKDTDLRGIDIVVKPKDNLWVAIQCKRQQRISKKDIESFLRTYRKMVEKMGQDYVVGMFVVHKREMEQNDGFWELVSTPGISLVYANEATFAEVLTAIDKAEKHYLG